jgi:carboxymethylenebutenolidase
VCHETWSAPGADGRLEPLEIPVEGGALPALRAAVPEDVEAIGACVLATDIYGPVPFYQEVARRLAAVGIATSVVDLFWREGPLAEVTREAAFARRGGMDERLALADAHAAVDALRKGGPDRVGVLGFCFGGMLALDLVAQRDDVVAVSFYGFPEGIAAPVRVRAPRPIDLVGDVRSPALAHWAGQDHNVPVDQAQRYDAAMAELGHDYVAHHYPAAGHSFLQGMVEDREDSADARLAWDRTVGYLTALLHGPGGGG